MEGKKIRLSHPQQRVLISHLKHRGKPLCNIGGYVFIDKRVNLDKLKEAIEQTILSMDCFSISINDDNEYSQIFNKIDRNDLEIDVIFDQNGTEKNLARLAQGIMNTPFELEDNHLYKTCVWAGNNCSGFVFVGHHIICDGWTFQMVAESVSANYRDEENFHNSYMDFIDCEGKYFNSERALKDEKYWDTFISNNVRKLNISPSKTCNGWREEYYFTNEEQEKINIIEKLGINTNTLLCAFMSCMSKKEYNTGIIGVPCFNRVGRKQKNTGGMCTSTMLSLANIDNSKSLRENIICYQNDLIQSYRHQKWPFEYMHLNRNSEIFIFSVNCYNTSMTYQYEDDTNGYCHELYSGYQMFPAQIILNRWGGKWLLQFDFMEDYFNQGDSEKYIFYFREFIDSIINNLSKKEFDNNCLTKIDKMQHQVEYVAKLSNISFYERICRVFSEDYSERILFVLNDEEILGKDFVKYIRGAVDVLNSRKLKKGDSVVVWMRNSLEYMVYIYACIAVGVRFIPTDISTPQERVSYLYENSNSKAIITDIEKEYKFDNYIKPDLKKSSSDFFPINIPENEQLYMLYTSGSTGMPKGVMISRHSMATYINWAEGYYGDELSFYMHSSPSFDLSLTTVFLPITSRGRIVIDKNSSPLYRLNDLNLASKVNAVKATPTQLSLMLNGRTDNINLKVVICGGEDFTISLADVLQDTFGNVCNIYNEYGPTECTIGCMCSKYKSQGKTKSVSIGIASPGTYAFVVNSRKNKFCSPGESGEIYIAGEQVALGYWKLPKEDKKYFLHNMFGCEKLYRTGDKARYTLDGGMEFLGRIGRQIKINGYRIELDSIENTLKNLNGIKNAAAWLEKGTPDYLVAVAETIDLSENEIREELKKKIPPYGIPHYIYTIDRMPETINGKINIELLKAKVRAEIGKNSYDDDRKLYVESYKGIKVDLENILREMFSYNGSMDDFDFVIQGGDSIRAIQLTARLKAEGYNISLMDILDYSKFDDMVSHIQTKQLFSEKREYRLPSNLRYLEETCNDFSEYYHEIHLVLNEDCLEEKKGKFLGEIEDKLVKVFPGLNCSYNDGVISYSDSSNHALFKINYIEENNEKKLCIKSHHILVDGVAWFELLIVIEKILNHKKCLKYSLPENWRFDEEVIYEWNKNKWKADSLLEEYRACVEDIMTIEVDAFTQDIVNVLSNRNGNFKYLLDCDARLLFELNQPNNIGCYSYFIPIDSNSNMSILDVINKVNEHKKVRIPDGELVRISYLGNLDKIIPKKFSLDEKSLDISRSNCSAWGCEYEITAYIKDNVMQVIVGTRIANNVDSLKSICESIIDEMKKNFDNFELITEDLGVF